MILDEIKKQNVEAMKKHDTVARSIYSILMNKAMLETIKKREKGEQLTDVDMVQILQKTIKELHEEQENFKKVNNQTQVDQLAQQIKIVEVYLPKMLSEEEIEKVIVSIEDKTIPNIMKHFKANYAGKCDMRKVQEIAKKYQG